MQKLQGQLQGSKLLPPVLLGNNLLPPILLGSELRVSVAAAQAQPLGTPQVRQAFSLFRRSVSGTAIS